MAFGAVARGAARLRGPVPFDLGVMAWSVGTAACRVSGWRLEQASAVVFCVGAVLLACLGAWCRPVRQVDARAMGALVAWTLLATLIWYRPEQVPGNLEVRYFHLYVLLGGALYAACGALGAWVVGTYGSVGVQASAVILGGWSVASGPSGVLATSGQQAFAASLACAVSLLMVPIGLWFAFSVGSWTAVGSIVSVLAYGCFAKGKRLFGVLVSAAGLMVAWANWASILSNLSSRLETWPLTIRQWGEHLWVGSGPDHSLLSGQVLTSQGWGYRHSDVLELGKSYGMVGVVLLLWCVVRAWSGASVWQRRVLLAMGMTMLVQTQACFPRVMALGCALFGWAASREREA